FQPSFLNEADIVSFSKYYYGENLTESGQDKVSSFKELGETINFTLLNSRMDMLPFIHPTRISSLIPSNDGYWFTGKTRFVSSGDAFSLKLTNNKAITIEALGNVEINGKIIVDANSKLNILAHKPLLMNNCELNSAGSISVRASQNVEIGKGTVIAKGIKFEIKNENED
ncbi:MAG: hypothetical protein K2N05_02785, partial [Muribaculaceae bacterium]|nr:hypothetical protein [Muribaculaceae bacterium]